MTRATELEHIPKELIERPHWIQWQRLRNGRKSFKQLNGEAAKSSEPNTWSDFQTVAEHVRPHHALGFVIAGDEGLTGVDLDGCLDEAGELKTWCVPIVKMLEPVSYGEVSQSGRGLKFLTRASKPPHSRCSSSEVSTEGGEQIECYDFNRFWCLTGRVYGEARSIRDGQKAIDEICRTYLLASSTGEQPTRRIEQDSAATDSLLRRAEAYALGFANECEGGRNNAAFRLAGNLMAFDDEGRRLSHSEIEGLVLAWNAGNNPPLHEDEVRTCVRSAGTNGTPRELKPSRPAEISQPAEPWMQQLTCSMNGGSGQPAESSHQSAWPAPIGQAGRYGIVGEFLRTVEPHTEADAAALLLEFIVSAGSILGRSSWCEVEATRHHANLFCCLVGQSANARKGSSKQQVNRFLNHCGSMEYDGSEHVQNWLADCQLSGLASGEALIWNVRDEVHQWIPKEQKRVLCDPGVDDKRLMLHEPEFGSLLQIAGRERNTLSATVRQAYDSGNLRNSSKGSPARSTGAHVSICGHITAAELRHLLSTNDSLNGFGNRFLWCAVKRSKRLPLGGDLNVAEFDHLAKRFLAAVDFANHTQRRINFDKEAERHWCEAYEHLSRERFGLFGGITSRAEANSLRLSLLFAMLDRADDIRIEHLQAALEVWRYCEASAACIFGSATGDSHADRIRSSLKEAGSDGLTRTQINSLFSGHATAQRIGESLKTLESAGFARMKKNSSGGTGRPAEVWVSTEFSSD